MPRMKRGERGSAAASAQWRKTMREKYGSDWRKVMAERGQRGGAISRGGGFAANRELARTAGAIGGKISKRRPKVHEGR